MKNWVFDWAKVAAAEVFFDRNDEDDVGKRRKSVSNGLHIVIPTHRVDMSREAGKVRGLMNTCCKKFAAILVEDVMR